MEAELRAQVDALMLSQAESSRRIADLTLQLENKSKEVATLHEVVAQLRTDDHMNYASNATTSDQKPDVETTTHQEQILRLEADRTALEQQLAQKDTSIAQLQADLSAAHAATVASDSRDSELEAQRRQIAELTEQVQDLKRAPASSAVAPAVEGVSGPSDEDQLRSELHEVQQQAASMRGAVNEALIERDDARRDLASVTTVVQGLRDKLAERDSEIASLTASIEEIRAEAQHSSAKLTEGGESIESVAVMLRHDNLCLEDENDALRRIVDAMVEERSSLKEAAAAMMGQLEQLHVQLRREREARENIVSLQAGDLEDKYGNILLLKQDELDAANAKVALLESTVMDLQRLVVDSRSRTMMAASVSNSPRLKVFAAQLASEAAESAAPYGAPKYHTRHQAASNGLMATPLPQGAARPVHASATHPGLPTTLLSMPTTGGDRPMPFAMQHRSYIPPELRNAILGDI